MFYITHLATTLLNPNFSEVYDNFASYLTIQEFLQTENESQVLSNSVSLDWTERMAHFVPTTSIFAEEKPYRHVPTKRAANTLKL